jgi:hypothetical protein
MSFKELMKVMIEIFTNGSPYPITFLYVYLGLGYLKNPKI